jgi:hypothetical protein
VDLLELVTVFRRHPVLTAVGLALSAVAAFGVLFTVQTTHGKPAIRQRSYTTYSAEMQMIVVDSAFGMGRAGIRPEEPNTFDKTVGMAQTYARLLVSDAVLQSVIASIGPLGVKVESQPVEQSPIVNLTLTGNDPKRLRVVGKAMGDALSTYLTAQQDAHGVPDNDRLSIRVLSATAPAVPLQSRQWEMALIAFLGPLLGAGAIGLLLDRRPRPSEAELEQRREEKQRQAAGGE